MPPFPISFLGESLEGRVGGDRGFQRRRPSSHVHRFLRCRCQRRARSGRREIRQNGRRSRLLRRAFHLAGRVVGIALPTRGPDSKAFPQLWRDHWQSLCVSHRRHFNDHSGMTLKSLP